MTAASGGRGRPPASPQAATAAKTPSADTATQIAAGAEHQERRRPPRDVLGAEPPQGHQHRDRGRAPDERDHQARRRRRRRARARPAPTKSSSAPGGWPATWVGQLPGAPTGIRSTKPLQQWRARRGPAGRSAGTRCGSTISRVRPERPSTSASVERPRHGRRRTSRGAAAPREPRGHGEPLPDARAEPDERPRAGVPGPTRGVDVARQTGRTAAPGAGWRAPASALQRRHDDRGRRSAAAPIAAPIHGARRSGRAGTRPRLGRGSAAGRQDRRDRQGSVTAIHPGRRLRAPSVTDMDIRALVRPRAPVPRRGGARSRRCSPRCRRASR